MRPPVPPFTEETARQKVQAAEDAWNTRDPEPVAAAYSEDSQWRNRDEFFTGRAAIVEFLPRKWERELEYALRKDLWAFTAVGGTSPRASERRLPLAWRARTTTPMIRPEPRIPAGSPTRSSAV